MKENMVSVSSILSRKIRPIHPGEIIRDLLEERDSCVGDLYLYNLELDEILEGDRPMTHYWAKNLESRLGSILDIKLGVSSELLMRLQRKVDIWDSKEDK